jgi:hypothetical protein
MAKPKPKPVKQYAPSSGRVLAASAKRLGVMVKASAAKPSNQPSPLVRQRGAQTARKAK